MNAIYKKGSPEYEQSIMYSEVFKSNVTLGSGLVMSYNNLKCLRILFYVWIAYIFI